MRPGLVRLYPAWWRRRYGDEMAALMAERAPSRGDRIDLIRGACRALGVAEPVTSPTFTIGQRYAGRVPVSHLDLYRLADLEHEDPALLDDYLTPDAVAFVEWPAAAEPRLERVSKRVELRHAGGDAREISVSSG